MNTPEDYILDALEQVLCWDLPDDEIADAANAQAYLMSGCCTGYYEYKEPKVIRFDNH